MGKLFFDLVKFGVLKQFGTNSRVPNFFLQKSFHPNIHVHVYIRPYKKRWDNNSWTSLEYCTLNVHLIVKIKFEANSRQICDFYFCLCNICPLSVWPSSIACLISFCLLSQHCLLKYLCVLSFYLLSVSLLSFSLLSAHMFSLISYEYQSSNCPSSTFRSYVHISVNLSAICLYNLYLTIFFLSLICVSICPSSVRPYTMCSLFPFKIFILFIFSPINHLSSFFFFSVSVFYLSAFNLSSICPSSINSIYLSLFSKAADFVMIPQD